MGLYSLDSTVEVANRKNTYVEAGIHEDLTSTTIEYKPTETSEFLAFTFTDDNGDKLSHTEWRVNTKGKVAFAALSDDDKEKYLGLVKQQLSRIKQIVAAVLNVKPESINIQADTFKEMAEKVVEATQSYFGKSKVRAKVVYDWRDYTSLANNPAFTFIENMSIPKEESAIRELANDKFKRSGVRDQEKRVENPLEIEDSSSDNKGSELPF